MAIDVTDTSETGLKRSFAWLARTEMGIKSGSCSIHRLQNHNMKALGIIENAAKAAGLDPRNVRVRGDDVQALQPATYECRKRWVTLFTRWHVWREASRP